jgi:hypothetical protein
LQAGVGTEVIFASNKPAVDQARDRVVSIDNFIAKRSGLSMDDETKSRLAKLEARTLDGSRQPVSIGRYLDALSETLVARMAGLTDEEIDYALAVLKRNSGIRLRADGRVRMTEPQFYEQARELRAMSANDTTTTVALVRTALKDEVTKRISELQDGVPNQFGGATVSGLSPAQAVLVAYSVFADDDLSFPSRGLNQFAARMEFQRRISQTGGVQQKAKVAPPGGTVKAYGPNGRLFAAPLDLAFDKGTLNGLLDRLTKGGA